MSVFFVLSIILAFSYLPKYEAADGPQSRIINGIEASIEDFPYQAQLHLNTAIVFDATGIPPISIITNAFCGGSIIHKNYVLTAAHCLAVDLIGFMSVVVKVGSDILDQGSDFNAIALEFCPHPKYTRSTVSNDIGIIKVDTDLYTTPTSTIAPIRLPQAPHDISDLYNIQLTVSGFGRTSDTSGLSNTLLYGYMKVVDREFCKDPNQYGSSFPETAYCVESPNSDSTTFCNGDSGSPMSAFGVQVCIVSFARAESCSGFLQGCTMIDIYLDWICCVTDGKVCAPDYTCDSPFPLLECPLLPIYPNARK